MNFMNIKKIFLITTLFLSACATAKKNYTEAEVLNETKRINAFFEEEFQAAIKESPTSMTYIGLKERYDELGDPSYEFFKKNTLVRTKAALKKLKGFNYNSLTPQAQLSYRLFKKQGENMLQAEKYFKNGYTVSQSWGPHSSMPAFMINMHRIDNESDAKAYVKRIWAFKPYFNTILKEMAKEDTSTYPFFIYDKVISDSTNIITGYPFDSNKNKKSPLYNDFEQKISKIKLSNAKKKILLNDLKNALLVSVKPSFNSVISKMTEMKKANPDKAYGIWNQKNGAKYYSKKLKDHTTTDLSAKEIHEMGLSEVTRIHSEMLEIAKKLKLDGDLKTLFKHVRENKDLFYPNTKAGRANYLKDTNKIISSIKKKLPDLFLTLPKADLKVKPVEAYREKSAGIAFYQSPALNGSRPGIYYVNLSDMSSVGKFDMEALIYHEALPGHHMQLSLAQELQKDQPTFRKFGNYNAFSEGWGLYAEYIPKEIGMYKNIYSDFGRLSMELWRATRLVVDTGIHYKKWSYDESLAYLRNNTPNSEDEIVKGIQRYFVNPGQATSYKVGQLEIMRLKKDLEKKLSSDFDIKRFHDAVLRNGTVPLSEMKKEVKKEFKVL